MMIKLDDKCYVAADQVVDVTINSRSDRINVRLKDGTQHSVSTPYKVTIYSELDRLVTAINSATGVKPAAKISEPPVSTEHVPMTENEIKDLWLEVDAEFLDALPDFKSLVRRIEALHCINGVGQSTSPTCPRCQAPGLLYECVHCSANSYPEDFAQQAKRVQMTDDQLSRSFCASSEVQHPALFSTYKCGARDAEAHHKILPANKGTQNVHTPTDWSAA